VYHLSRTCPSDSSASVYPLMYGRSDRCLAIVRSPPHLLISGEGRNDLTGYLSNICEIVFSCLLLSVLVVLLEDRWGRLLALLSGGSLRLDWCDGWRCFDIGEIDRPSTNICSSDDRFIVGDAKNFFLIRSHSLCSLLGPY